MRLHTTIYFLCLANSKKYGGRCVGGIQVDLNASYGIQGVIYRNNEPKWVRLVSNSENGQIETELVKDYKLLDIMKADIIPCPYSYQCENAYFVPESLKKVSSLNLLSYIDKKNFLEHILSHDRTLFGNRYEKIWHSVIKKGRVKKSLMLIKPSKVSPYFDTKYERFRIKFWYNNCQYDLPITDLEFIEKFKKNKLLLKRKRNIYFTISLGEEFTPKGNKSPAHYKLVAGIIYF
ncbi:MAG: hypothetical protein ABIK10_01685 [candidate division WOR-3 bacterium]